MQLLADRLVTLKVAERISDETVRTELKKTISSRGRKSSGVFRRYPALTRQVLDQRIPNTATLRRVVEPWQAQRNAEHATIHWRFNTHVARETLAALYPSI